jgi:geranylgeranylglycerol-phosphate geranylgeranyltransferase
MKSMASAIKLIRPLNCLAAAACAWTGMLLAGASFIPGMKMAYALAAVFLVAAGGMAANDVFDATLDTHNKPNRPIPSGKVSAARAKAYSILLFIAGNFLALIAGRQEFILAIIATALLVAYSWKLKKTAIAGHAGISLLFALAFLFGGLSAGNVFAAAWAAAVIFFASMGREIYKSIDDMLGDKNAGLDSIALKLGVLKTKTVAASFMIVAILLTFVPYYLGQMREIYMFFAIIADITLISAAGAPVRYSSRLSKAGLILMAFAFFIGTAQIQSLILSL